MDLIFNELSASGGYDSRYSASKGIQRLILLSKELIKIGFSGYLRTVENFSQLLLASGYTIHQWATDREVGADRDMQRWLLTFAAKAPYIDQFINQAEDGTLIEFTFNDEVCAGLGLAYLWKSGALSLDADNRFTLSDISLKLYQIDSDGESESVVKVESIYKIEQLATWRKELDHNRLIRISSGDAFISDCEDIFPYLSIGDKASKQIRELTGSEIYFREVIRHFHVLNQTMGAWSEGPFNPNEINWSPETSSTLDRYGDQRTFICKDGESRVFSFHSKLMSANKRIHFYPVTEARIVYIGYVGNHLQTTRYRT